MERRCRSCGMPVSGHDEARMAECSGRLSDLETRRHCGTCGMTRPEPGMHDRCGRCGEKYAFVNG